MKAVFYRHNETLAALVAKANPDFVHEFPAEMSVEDIKQELLTRKAVKPLMELVFPPDNSFHDCEVHVDGTVMAAGIDTVLWQPCSLHLIRQDNVGAYDWYATRVAEAANLSSRVIVVSDRIADHNSEALSSREDFSRYQTDETYRAEVENLVVAKWVERLAKHGITPEVVNVGTFRGMLLSGAVVVCDHHNGDICELEDSVGSRGGIWFNAFPSCGDDDFLAM